MDINDIKAELDKMYKQYKKQKSTLNVTQTNEVVMLLKQLSQNGDAKDVAERLVVFSADVCGQYFDELTKGSIIPLNIVESIINSYIGANTDTSNERFYVKKYATMAIKVINNYTDSSYNSKTIAKLITLVANIGLKSDKNMSQFERVVVETKGKIYFVDFSSINEKGLANVNKITADLITKGKLKTYSDLIEKWSIKHGLSSAPANNSTEPNEKAVKIEEEIVSNEVTEEAKPAKVQVTNGENAVSPIVNEDTNTTSSVIADKSGNKASDVSSEDSKTTSEKPIAETSDKANPTSTVAPEKTRPAKSSVQILYERLKKDMDKEQEAIITAFTDMITPVGKAFESIQGEINKSRELGAENIALKSKITDLETQLSEYRSRLQTANQSLMTAKTENDELKNQLSSLESQNTELDSKLNDAYAINSRESSLEAEKVRSELKKAFSFLYEDWLEYEFSDVSEENYESLQAIIKKIFRSLERNGIDFKGNN